MDNFKSDNITIASSTTVEYESTFAFIPTGAILPMAGPVSLYSNPVYQQLGLLPCNGSQWQISSYQSLYEIITQNGTSFPYGPNTNGSGGAGTTHFVLPNFLATKYFIKGKSTGTNIGIANNSVGHSHSLTESTNVSGNNTTWRHYHYSNINSSASYGADHNHSWGGVGYNTAGTANLVQNKADGTSTAASTSHSHGAVYTNGGSTGSWHNVNTHDHGNGTAYTNWSAHTNVVPGVEGSHLHPSPSWGMTTSDSKIVYPWHENLLYFIKA